MISLASGAVIVQAIPILTMPFLTRMYQPEDFSVLAIYTALVTVLGPLVTGRYEMAIMHADSETDARQALGLSTTLTFFMSIFFAALLWLFAEPVAELLGHTSLVNEIRWIFIPLLATGMIQSYSLYLNWASKFGKISIGRVTQNLTTSATSLTLGAKGFAGGLIWAQISGLMLSSIFFWKSSKLKGDLPSWAQLKVTAKKYSQYPIFSAPAALLDTASMSACIFVLGRFYPQDVLGQFSLTHRLLLVPMVLIGTSVGQAFFQHAATNYREGAKLLPLLSQTSRKLLLYSLPGFIVAFALAPDFFALVFGQSWRTAGEYTRIVAAGYWIRLAVSPVSSVFMVVHRVKVGTFWQVSYFCTSFIVLGSGAALQLPIKSFLILYTAHEVVMYGFFYWLARRVCIQQKEERIS
ncbi:MAG: hypothetical protein EOP04_15795 [Proteobacteria bacterium]|nr:MAG: hypothetical protein EOP04_15795 [Pseudomonadota bacterium]